MELKPSKSFKTQRAAHKPASTKLCRPQPSPRASNCPVAGQLPFLGGWGLGRQAMWRILLLLSGLSGLGRLSEQQTKDGEQQPILGLLDAGSACLSLMVAQGVPGSLAPAQAQAVSSTAEMETGGMGLPHRPEDPEN